MKARKIGGADDDKPRFRPKNKEKYRGDHTNIIYRSKYELTFMMWADHNPNVIEWSSEEFIITYRSLLDDIREKKLGLTKRKWHRYYIDFYIKVKGKDGSITRYLVEVKPYHETVQPIFEGTKKSKKTIQRQSMTWIVNKAKWAAARAYCAKRGMTFKIVTEKELYGRNR
jgi:hypothetical protein